MRRGLRFIAGVLALMVAGVAGLGGCDDATQTSPDGAAPDGSPDSALCQGIEDEYAVALASAKECTVGAAHQCEVQARAGFWCNCQVWVNSDGDALAAVVSRFQSAGCFRVCTGSCLQLSPTTCVADSTSSTGGICKPLGILAVQNADDGQSLPLMVGDEVDITLSAVGAGSYSTMPQLSSDSLSVVEIAIPAMQSPGGLTRLYRMKAVSSGVVEVRIPFEPGMGEAAQPDFTLTITVS